VWESILSGENVLCVSNEILEEYTEILQRLAGELTAKYVIDALMECKYVELITPYYHFNLIAADPDDNKFVDCAISAQARYVVTNDKHFDVLRQTEFPVVDVIALKDFVKFLRH